jgi:hypothetical protein
MTNKTSPHIQSKGLEHCYKKDFCRHTNPTKNPQLILSVHANVARP